MVKIVMAWGMRPRRPSARYSWTIWAELTQRRSPACGHDDGEEED
ncbi:hypothetical protein OHA25_54495 [Nonomuraea sp. NBC_00507]